MYLRLIDAALLAMIYVLLVIHHTGPDSLNTSETLHKGSLSWVLHTYDVMRLHVFLSHTELNIVVMLIAVLMELPITSVS